MIQGGSSSERRNDEMKKSVGIVAVLYSCIMSGSEYAAGGETNTPGGVRSLVGPWMACIPAEILDEGNRVEKTCRERLVLTEELSKIKKEDCKDLLRCLLAADCLECSGGFLR